MQIWQDDKMEIFKRACVLAYFITVLYKWHLSAVQIVQIFLKFFSLPLKFNFWPCRVWPIQTHQLKAILKFWIVFNSSVRYVKGVFCVKFLNWGRGQTFMVTECRQINEACNLLTSFGWARIIVLLKRHRQMPDNKGCFWQGISKLI